MVETDFGILGGLETSEVLDELESIFFGIFLGCLKLFSRFERIEWAWEVGLALVPILFLGVRILV